MELLQALCLVLSAVGQFYTDFDAAWTLSDKALRQRWMARRGLSQSRKCSRLP